MKRKIEVFTADCPLCKDTMRLMRQETCPECEIIEQRCAGECSEPAKDYGIKAVPTVVVDGEVRFMGKPTLTEVKNLFG